MKQVNLDEIACDMGECSLIIKSTSDPIIKKETIRRLQVLLNDYNLVTCSNLKLHDVLGVRESVESEL
jgi:uncharacterized Fe-S cluster-containing radical SAM superfamily protein